MPAGGGEESVDQRLAREAPNPRLPHQPPVLEGAAAGIPHPLPFQLRALLRQHGHEAHPLQHQQAVVVHEDAGPDLTEGVGPFVDADAPAPLGQHCCQRQAGKASAGDLGMTAPAHVGRTHARRTGADLGSRAQASWPGTNRPRSIRCRMSFATLSTADWWAATTAATGRAYLIRPQTGRGRSSQARRQTAGVAGSGRAARPNYESCPAPRRPEPTSSPSTRPWCRAMARSRPSCEPPASAISTWSTSASSVSPRTSAVQQDRHPARPGGGARGLAADPALQPQ